MQQRQVFLALGIWAACVTTVSYLHTVDSENKSSDATVDVIDTPSSEPVVKTEPSLPRSGAIKTPARQTYRQVLKFANNINIARLKDSGLNLRGLFCAASGECYDTVTSAQCESSIDPYSLSLAVDQVLCQPSQADAYYCTVSCKPDGTAEWHAHGIEWCKLNSGADECKTDPYCCPPRPLHLNYVQVAALKAAIPGPDGVVTQPEQPVKQLPFKQTINGRDPSEIARNAIAVAAAREAAAREKAAAETAVTAPVLDTLTRPVGAPGTFRQDFLGQAALSDTELETLKQVGFNTRGLICQHQDGTPVCYRQDNQARERCPPYVTPAYLSLGAGQYSCLPSMRDRYYCTALCQEGSAEVKWNAHEISWCNQHGQCPDLNTYTPIEEFAIEPFVELKKGKIFGACTGGDGLQSAGRTDPRLKDITVGILARGSSELESIRDAMRTWAEGGLLEAVGEVIVYLNDRTPEVDRILLAYTRPPYNAKLLGDATNYGITYGINWLAGNATKPYFLFLEKDFQLIEGRGCLNEQLINGIRLLESDTAQVVRYRSRRHPGFPNWADNAYRGHEDDCLTSRQPNLFCNVFHWIESPDQRWPEHFWDCDRKDKKKRTSKDPMFYCSDAYFCNWTNNPVMFKPSWWYKEYVTGSFTKKLSGNDPYHHLEGYMNWEPNAWNDRKWTVAQGEGLFTHRDRNNFGV